jgi:hypothetical protein
VCHHLLGPAAASLWLGKSAELLPPIFFPLEVILYVIY